MAAYDPVFYALVHQGNPGDVAFYLQECAGAARILELGCGYGRLSLALAQTGSEVWGIDLHDGLLALAESRRSALDVAAAARVHLSHGDMRAIQIAGPFDFIIIPFSGLYCLDSDEDVLRCLSSARALLAPNGVLLFDSYAADGFHEECVPEDYAEDTLDHVALIAKEGVAYDVYERSSWDRVQQRLVATYVHVPDGEGETIEHDIAQRYLLSNQVAGLLTQAGFRIEHLWGSFDRGPFGPDSEALIVRARRAEPDVR
jgi:SAM-dependent methyltransferase